MSETSKNNEGAAFRAEIDDKIKILHQVHKIRQDQRNQVADLQDTLQAIKDKQPLKGWVKTPVELVTSANVK